MSLVLIGLAGVVLVAVLFLVTRKSGGARPGPPRSAPALTPVKLPPVAADHVAARVDQALPPHPAAPPPAALAGFEWRRAESLPSSSRQALLAELRRLPPPSRAFHQLVSPQFVARASSAELSELVIGEPQVAVKVLASVNSALYGLQTPVTSIGQAVTFLGLNSVRSICLQYMLSASFKADTPAQQRRFELIWSASALASELCFKLAQQLRLPDPGGMVTQLVLSFLGHFAAAARMPSEHLLAADQGLLARARAEQQALGVPAAEIGGLLLQEWALPAGLVADVVDIDRQLVTPADGRDELRAATLAVCYFSARLGEKLARGEPVDLLAFDPWAAQDPDYFWLAGHLERPRLARLPELLRGPELVRAVQTMLAGMKRPA